MNLHINDILDHLFQKQALEDVDAGDIEQLVIKYPFCAPAQYLLAKKYQQLGDNKYTDQVKKSALYFTNPHWLNALLHPEALPEEEIAEPPFREAIVDIAEQKIIIEENPFVPEVEQTTTNTVFPAETKDAEIVQPEETYDEPVLPVVEIKTGDEVLEQINDIETDAPDSGVDADQSTEELRLQDDVKLPTGDFSLAAAKAAFDKPLPVVEHAGGEIIPIEPLHTVDYFASQGIKLSHEYEGKDTLSKKLKSFTEWLKTMKKIHPERLETEMDSNAQSSIQHIAEHSNEQKEVVTEAMAEVFARQGLHKKAIETYQKLSLLNPDKRVYFAAKISKLNEN